ncbi:MAG: ABC transporter transmembrane domain-containing protein [Alphaproteobacteria bacterium]|nr:ABC transporter transmembrane domain-containing protein [Alphaproteobacteria bacterium]
MKIAGTSYAQRHAAQMQRLRAYKPQGAAHETGYLLLGTTALNLLSLALPIMTLQVYDRILPNPESGTLPILLIGVVFALACETGLRLARAWMMGWNGAVYEHALSSAAMQRVLGADMARSRKTGVGEFLHRMGAISRLKDFESGYVAVTLAELAFIPVFIGVIFYIAAPLTPVPLALLAVFVAVSLWQGRRLRETLAARDAHDDTRYEYLVECLKGVHTVKAFALENLLSRRYEHLQEKSGLGSFFAAEASTRAFNFGTMISHLMMAAVMTAGAVAVVGGSITTGALIATLQLSGRLMQPAQRGLSFWTRYQEVSLARSKVADIFTMPVLKRQPAETLPPPAGYLSAQGVSFRSVLSDIRLSLAPGDTVAISGPPGSGKTTLLEILSGFYPPDRGEVLIDNVDTRRYPPEDLPAHIGYLATEGTIFHGTIRENLTRFGILPEKQALDIARQLYIDRDVASLPAGYDTVLQPQGSDDVPPGLRQRISIARVLAAHPKIILFDEADRALDRDGYNMVFRLLARIAPQTALVLISDDRNLTGLAARHYRLENGGLHEISLTSPLSSHKKAAS